MFFSRLFSSAVFSISLFAMNANAMQSVGVVNNNAHAMTISGENLDKSLYFRQTIPAFTQSLLLVAVAKLKSAQEMLYDAIANDSAEEVSQAISLGANIAQLKDHKKPLYWAVLYRKANAARCLLEHGAI